MFGNTRAVAEAVASALRASGCDVRCSDVSMVSPEEAFGGDLVVLGAPTHAFSLSQPGTRADAVRQGASAAHVRSGMREWLASVGLGPRPAALTAIFDTRVSRVRWVPAAAGPAIARLLRRRGVRLAGKPAAFLVDDIEGPLSPRQLEQATRWGHELAAAVRAKPSVA